MRSIYIFLTSLLPLLNLGCKKYLEEKPDKKLVVPATIQDAQAMLDNTQNMTIIYPSAGEIAAGDFYLLSADWQAASTTVQNSYLWQEDVFNDADRNDWSLPYVTVYYANIVLDALDKGSIVDGTGIDRNNIQGQALFFRSYAFFHLLQQFSKAWDTRTAGSDLGIALRLSPDLNLPTTRATVAQCYDQVLKDTKDAVALLPDEALALTRPTKKAANGFLARVYLSMAEYDSALLYSNRAIQNNPALLDYNSLDTTAVFSFQRFNKEVLLHTLISTPGTLYPPKLKVDSLLLASYGEDDLRKKLFFQRNADNTYSFKGSYDGSSVLFNGPAADEMYLVRAECYARQGNATAAVADLNTLLSKRWKTGAFKPYTAATPAEALSVVLSERRKELVFRGSRWSDLRRLNKEAATAITLKRTVNGQQYVLPPNDNRYVFPIPLNVVQMTGIEQNPR